MEAFRTGRRLPARYVALIGLAASWMATAAAQEPAPPAETVAPAGDVDPATLADLVRRLQQLEADNARLREEVGQTQALREDLDRLSTRYDELSRRLARPAATPEAARPSTENAGFGFTPGSMDDSSGGGVLPTQREAQDVGNRRLGRIPLTTYYNYNREGFVWESENQELQLRFRAEFQADTRIYNRDMDPVSSGFYLPRTRFYFQGYLTRPLEYQISFQQGYGSFAPLNVYFNYHPDDRIQFRIGRFKAPFTYEWYKLNNWRFITPERSLFSANFGLNRMLGLMAWGEILEKRLEYAVGVFDGPRNSFEDFNSSKDVIALLNIKPWETRDGHPLQDLNIGGSLDYGYQNNPLTPGALRTSTNASGSGVFASSPVAEAVVPFLAFNNGVTERGLRALWELHVAYYYKGLSFIGAWDSGFDSFAPAGQNPVRLPVGGWFAEAAYLLTGETVRDRIVVDPIRRFDLRRGRFGLGAWEPYARYSELNVGSQVFTAGLADPNLWTDRVQMVDVGVNWYLNKWVKVIFDWEHPMFANPVYYKPGPFLQSSSDLFWFRFQVYF